MQGSSDHSSSYAHHRPKGKLIGSELAKLVGTLELLRHGVHGIFKAFYRRNRPRHRGVVRLLRLKCLRLS